MCKTIYPSSLHLSYPSAIYAQYPLIYLSYTNAFATRNRSDVLSNWVTLASQRVFSNTQVGSFEDAQVSRELIASLDAANISGNHQRLWKKAKFKSKYKRTELIGYDTHAKWCDAIPLPLPLLDTRSQRTSYSTRKSKAQTRIQANPVSSARGGGGIE